MFGKPRKGVRKELEQDGTRADAVVVEIAERGVSIQMNGNVAGAEASLKTTLRVQPPDGMPAFDVRQSFRYSQFAVPGVGDHLRVIYDPDDHDHIMIDESAPARPAVAVHSTDLGSVDLGTVLRSATVIQGDASGIDLNAIFSQLGAQQAAAAGAGAAPDPVDQLTKLAALKQQGLLTDAEFDEQKARILRPR